MAGAAVVLVGIHAPAINAGVRTDMSLAAFGSGNHRFVIAMHRLPSGRLPAEGRRKHGRQQDGEQYRGDVFGGAAHERILSHISRQTCALHVAVVRLRAP